MSAVVFDFDGVIADSEPHHLGAFREVLAVRGWDLSDEGYYRRYLGFGDSDFVRHYASDHGRELTEADFESLLEEKATAFGQRLESGAMLFPGAAPCIRRLAARFPLAIASGALRSEIETVLSAGGLLGHFKAIISIEDVARGKPAPDPYLLAARQLGVPPAGCVAIEDAPGGIESAATAGLGVIGVTTSVPAEALAAAHLVVGSLDEITVEMVSRLAAGPRP